MDLTEMFSPVALEVAVKFGVTVSLFPITLRIMGGGRSGRRFY
jgi:hypothetical protein